MVIYGEYKEYADGCEAEAKERCKKDLHNLIDELCERDDFWIKKEIPSVAYENTIGWKIAIPHMKNND